MEGLESRALVQFYAQCCTYLGAAEDLNFNRLIFHHKTASATALQSMRCCDGVPECTGRLLDEIALRHEYSCLSSLFQHAQSRGLTPSDSSICLEEKHLRQSCRVKTALSARLHPLPAKVRLSVSRTSPVLRALYKH